jgi:hypothetical protein
MSVPESQFRDNPRRPRWLGKKGAALLAAALATAMALSACGGTAAESAPVAATETVAVTETVTVSTPAAPPATSSPIASESGEAGSDAPSSEASPPPHDEGNIAVPYVVGLDHQHAQDTMQAAGLYLLDEEDATGQGRLLVWDRNWTVVAQSPAAGTLVDEDAVILLSSVKDGD